MAKQHTPGPWRIRDGSMRFIEADGHVGPIADMRSRLDYPAMDPIVADTLDANARLIAAAPDLLAALKMVMQHGRIDNSEARLNMVAAAIARAESA